MAETPRGLKVKKERMRKMIGMLYFMLCSKQLCFYTWIAIHGSPDLSEKRIVRWYT